MQGPAPLHFLLKTFKDEDVGIDCHADGKNESGNGGKREGRVNRLKGGYRKQNVERKCQHCDKAWERIVSDQEDRNNAKSNRACSKNPCRRSDLAEGLLTYRRVNR